MEEAFSTLERQPPEMGLPTVRSLRARLERLEAAYVERAVQSGWTWRQVANALGVSKQAAHKKHASRIAASSGSANTSRSTFLVTGRARRAVWFAREEARAAGHREVGPAHLVLGLLRLGQGPAAEALARAGVTVEAGRKALGGDGQSLTAGESIPVAPELRSVFEESLRDAVRLGDDYLGVQHLLRVLAREGGGPVLGYLRSLGVDEAEVARHLDDARAREEKRVANEH